MKRQSGTSRRRSSSTATGSCSTLRRATREEPQPTSSGFNRNITLRRLQTTLCRGVEFGIETKALLYKRMCAFAGLHAIVIKGFCKVFSSKEKTSVSMVFWSPRLRSTSRRRSLWTTVGETLGTQFTWLVGGALFNLTGRPCKFRPRWGPGVTM